ncbi:MAG: hypothetical protein IT369_22340 [Candidatus Latescibacteria bacterium]|nr:hypothetical protein [Candidatus Latescibacterota bacterium]
MVYLEVGEDQVCRVDAHLLGEAAALRLHQQYHHLLEVVFPNPLHPRHYLLRSRGWAGQLDLDGLTIELRPKIPLANLFAMVEQAYGLEGLAFLPGTGATSSLPQVFAALASLLARRVEARFHQGLYREYREQQEEVAWVRGRVLFPPGRRPSALRCAFQEHRADTADNQILAGTLQHLRSVAFADPRVQRQIQRAHRLLAGGGVLVRRVRPEECVGRFYHRLNRDYALLHGLCRFFLEHRGPALGAGDYPMVPFAVYLPTLFERFAAHWLARHLPASLHLDAQYRAPLEGSEGLAFRIDLVLRAGQRGPVLAVIDTKYKAANEVTSEDLQQVVAYAVRLGTAQAFLVYPSTLTARRRIRVGGVQVETLCFALDGHLERAGEGVLSALSRLKYA